MLTMLDELEDFLPKLYEVGAFAEAPQTYAKAVAAARSIATQLEQLDDKYDKLVAK
jgi:hypothetical protein